MGFFIRILIASIVFLNLSGSHLRADGAKEDHKKATVLLIHMFRESYEKSRDLQVTTLIERIEKAFKEKEIDATIIPVASNPAIRDAEKRRKKLFDSMDGLLLKSRHTTITHIIFAGHGNSEGNQVVIGDLLFGPGTIGHMVVDFELLRQFLAPKVKVFLYGCSTFKGTDKEIEAKAEWFRRILKAGSVEVFGYEHPIDNTTSDSFWTLDFKDWLSVYSSMLFIGFFKYGIDNRVFFTRQHWLTFAKVLPCTVAAAFASYLTEHMFNKYLKYTDIITMLRAFYYHDSIGTAVTFDHYKKAQSIRLLGHDYFRNQFVSQDS